MVHDLPGVGENLQDHLELYLQYACTQPVSLYPSLLWYNQPAIGAEWLFNGTGIGASNQFEAGGFIRTRPEFEWPNIQYHFLPVAINYNGSNGVKEHGFQAHMGSMRSPSRGRIQVKSKDPRQHPSILFNYMATEQDWQEFRDGIRLTREIMQQPALDAFRGREISPGIDVQTDEQLDKFIREHAETAFHPSCSCKMGTDEMAVVDGEGRVHGMQSLRVVDASIMPIITTGNLNAPTIMIAEKIADKIRGRKPLPRSNAAYYVAGDAPVNGKPMRDITPVCPVRRDTASRLIAGRLAPTGFRVVHRYCGHRETCGSRPASDEALQISHPSPCCTVNPPTPPPHLILPPRRPNLAPRNRFTPPRRIASPRNSITRRFPNVRFSPPAQAALRCLAHGRRIFFPAVCTRVRPVPVGAQERRRAAEPEPRRRRDADRAGQRRRSLRGDQRPVATRPASRP